MGNFYINKNVAFRLETNATFVRTVTYALVRYKVCIPNVILRTENNNRQRPPLGDSLRSYRQLYPNP